MSNTLAELQQECERIGHRVTDANLPLKMYGKNCAVNLQLYGDNGNYWVEVRSSIDHDENIAIIMQMFEDGNSDSIATAIANRIKQRTIDKACEWLRTVDVNDYIKIVPGFGYVIEDEDAIKDFRKAMEE